MIQDLKIGFVIADEDEFAPLRNKASEIGAVRHDLFSREGYTFGFSENGKTVTVNAVLCGIGKVNAATAAAFLIAEGCSIILNAGLSGGISGICRGECMVGTEYIEHDFDLTGLGYKPCEKPLQNYIYKADLPTVSLMESVISDVKRGVVVSGDCFVSDDKKRNFLKDTFGAMSCDMESAAIAYVCELAGVRFAALRRISDDAGNDAAGAYRSMNETREELLIDMLLKFAKMLLSADEFWQ